MANLRQVTETAMVSSGLKRCDISAREVRDKNNDPSLAVIETLEYEASGGKEIFFQWIDPSDRTLFSLLRLRIPSEVF